MNMGTALIRIPDKTAEGLLEAVAAIKDNYTYQTRHFVRWARETGHYLDENGVGDYFRFLNEPGKYKANTVRSKRTAIKKRVRQLYRDAPSEQRDRIDRVLYDLDHDSDTVAPKVNTAQITVDKVISAQEYRELLLRCRSDRQRAFIQFLYATGCRVSELTGTRLDRCENLGSSVKVRILGKGKKERFVRIPSALFDFIRATFAGSTYLFETSKGNPYPRVYVTNQVRKIGARIGRKISAHSLRHSFATRMVQQYPGKLDAVSLYLGHSSTSITLDMYVHTQLSDDELFDLEEGAI